MPLYYRITTANAAAKLETKIYRGKAFRASKDLAKTKSWDLTILQFFFSFFFLVVRCSCRNKNCLLKSGYNIIFLLNSTNLRGNYYGKKIEKRKEDCEELKRF